MKHEQFNDWLKKEYSSKPEIFHQLRESYKWGIYLEFFDSIDVDIDVYNNGSGEFGWSISIKNNNYFVSDAGCEHRYYLDTRPEAHDEAIKKAFGILEQ